MATIKLEISGMTCNHCVKRVSDALNALAGVTATVTLDPGMATIQASKEINIAELVKTVSAAGYSAQVVA